MADRKPLVEKTGEHEVLQAGDRLDVVLTNERLPQKTGIIKGWVPTENTGTTIDISAGEGWLVDNATDPLVPVHTRQSTSAFIGVIVQNVVTEVFTYFHIDAGGLVQQQNTAPTRDEFRTKQFVCVSYQPLVDVVAVHPIGQAAFEGDFYSYDTLAIFGMVGAGNVYDRSDTVALTMKVSAGEMGYPNANRGGTLANRRDPHFRSQNASGLVNAFVYVINNGINNASVLNDAASVIDTANRSNGSGALVALANNRSGISIIYRDLNGKTAVEYTVAQFNPNTTTLEEALEAAITTSPLILNHPPFQALYALEYPKDAPDLDLCIFHRLNFGGGTGGGGGSRSPNSAVALTIVSPHVIEDNVATIFSPAVDRSVNEIVVQTGAITSGSAGSFTFQLYHGINLATLTLIDSITVTQGTERATKAVTPVLVPANNIFVVNTTAIGAFPIATKTRHKRFFFHVRMTPP